jgi:hypothetical protein
MDFHLVSSWRREKGSSFIYTFSSKRDEFNSTGQILFFVLKFSYSPVEDCDDDDLLSLKALSAALLFITSISASLSVSKSVFIYRIVVCPTNHLSEKRSDWDFLPRENVCPGGIDFEHLTHIVCPVKLGPGCDCCCSWRRIRGVFICIADD